MTVHLELRSGVYQDSVRLMQISAELAADPAVEAALVAMATPVNLELLPTLGLDPPPAASPNDLMVALVTTSVAARDSALLRLSTLLAAPTPVAATADPVPARTTASAARAVTGPGIALVSTPGSHAFVEAMDALEAGLWAHVFSDNVPVEQEVALKRFAAGKGLLVLGPDCGTAVVSGIGLGFATVVRPGPVGLVAASGTGAQQVMGLLAHAGVGISHCLGVGGRDLSAAVGGLSTLTALDLLAADPATELIVVLSKPPAPEVAAAVAGHAARLSTPVLLGPGYPDLTATVEAVLDRLGVSVPIWPAAVAPAPAAPAPTASTTPAPTAPPPGRVVGLYSGGTLAAEADALLGAVPHEVVDLGADEFTVGRPHPMIDPSSRLARIAALPPEVSVLLLDVVLGHGAHPDPAGALAPALAALPPTVAVVVALIGSPDDPQNYREQFETLTGLGASVFAANATAARHAATLGAAPEGPGGRA